MKVALFDIDGTIVTKVTSSPTSKQLAYTRAIDQVYGISDLNYMDYAIFGLTDRGILDLLLKENGLSPDDIQAGEADFIQALLHIHTQLAATREQQYGPLPGAKALLEALKDKDIKLGLATGNLEELGWFKLREANLDQYFEFGGFAEAGADRADIVRDAIAKSGETNLHEIVLLGDTFHDIDAARRTNITGRAVATGKFNSEELIEYSGDPKSVLTDLTDTDAAMKCLLFR